MIKYIKYHILFFILVLGNAYSQVSFFASFSIDSKTSFSETYEGSTLLENNTKYSELVIYSPRKTFNEPIRVGVGLGINYKRHNLNLVVRNGDVCYEKFMYLKLYNDGTGPEEYAPIRDKVRAPQRNLYLQYDFYLLKKERKTNLFISTSASLIYRNGPKGIGPVGEINFAGSLGGQKYYSIKSASFTDEEKYAFGFGGGIGTDLYIKGLYLFTFSGSFTFSRQNLSFTNYTIKISDPTSVQTYNLRTNPLNTGWYFGISRRFQIVPWKPVKTLPIVQFFQSRLEDNNEQPLNIQESEIDK